ncbi:MAG: alpha-mannosidase [Cyanobacteriota bacterium]|nr:alpha-mannosidase [Cyanobacteriota bacterium]
MSHSLIQTLNKLRHLVQTDVRENWRYSSQDFVSPPADFTTWQSVQLNEKGYIIWEAGGKVCWLAQRFVVPSHLNGYPLDGLSLRLVLTWWADDAKIFVNNRLVQEGDLFESSVRILLTEAAIPGEEFAVTLRLVSPGHDIGGLMGSFLVYGQSLSINSNEKTISGEEGSLDTTLPDPGFIADELAVLHRYWQAFEPEKVVLLAEELKKLERYFCSSNDSSNLLDLESFTRALSDARLTLIPHAANLKQRRVKMLSHAHLDLAWLWEVEETWDVAQRTFESVLALQKDFRDLTFCHTSPALYEWVEKNRPDLFSAIQDAANRKSWEVLGGMWVEPDVNLVSGESIVRQLLYGQRYTRAKFGKIATVAWLTDSFGFCWQLPQFLKQGGIEYFVTQKLHWNDTTQFPYGAFYWESPDGTQIFTLMSPPNIAGIMDTDPMKIVSYAVDWELQTKLQDIFWLPGVGDRGGGPSRDMLEVQESWRQSPFFPRLEFTTAQSYLRQIEGQLQQQEEQGENSLMIPTWKDELYLEFHRGCYTTRADQKRANRRCETLLYQGELWSTLAEILGRKQEGHIDNAKSINGDNHLTQIEAAWKKVLFNQFHDILPGTSIPEVFARANQDWEEALNVGKTILAEALDAIASRISLPSPPHPNAKPIFAFNSLNWRRCEVVSLPRNGMNWEIYNSHGDKLPTQVAGEEILFLARDVPAIGYRLFWYAEVDSSVRAEEVRGDDAISDVREEVENRYIFPFQLENSTLRVIINPQTGEISSIFDKLNQREVLSSAGNQLQAFKDEGQYWDAWNIDPNYQQHPLPPLPLKSIAWIERGEIRQRIRIVRQLNTSQLTQDYILDADSHYLKIATTANWQERHVLLKAAFPLNLEADFATYEIPGGAIERTTKPQTPAEKAKWEVPAQQWADLTMEGVKNKEDSSQLTEYGVSLLNDCKYGYDAQPNQLRLSLLRGSTWPDCNADFGNHQFSYAVYPHAYSWQGAQTVRKGYELNQPLQIVRLKDINFKKNGIQNLSFVNSFIGFGAENLILMAFKSAEEETGTYILRYYEAHGEEAKPSISSPLGLKLKGFVDLLERPLDLQTSPISEHSVRPWKIESLACTIS